MLHERVIVVPPQLRAVVLAAVSDSLATETAEVQEAARLLAQEVKRREEETEAVQHVLTSLTELAGELQAQERQRLQEMQQVAIEIAIAVASRLLHRRIEANEGDIATLVQHAVEQLNTTRPIKIFLHPDDMKLLESRIAAGHLIDTAKLSLLADETVKRGDCRADAGDSSIRFSVEEQLADIRCHLLETLPEATIDRRASNSGQMLRRFPDRRYTA